MRKTIPHIAILLIVAACGRQPQPQPADAVAERPLKEQRQDTQPTADTPLVLNGSVEADPTRTLRIVAPISGRIEGLALETGDAVRAGQTVAQLVGSEAAELNMQRRQAESECRLAERELALKQTLFSDGMASEQEVTAATERLAVAQAAIGQLAALPTGDIRVAMNGTLLQRPVTNGQYVQSGELLMEVADLDMVWVMADVYEGDISRLHEGDSVVVSTLSYPNESRAGVVDKIYAALDPESKTIKVRVALNCLRCQRRQPHSKHTNNPDRHLLPGMFATVKLGQMR